MDSLIDCLAITVLHWWTVDSGNLAVVVVCLEVMVRTKTTARKSAGVPFSAIAAATAAGPLNRLSAQGGRQLCRFPGCTRSFAQRQGMSRHMKAMHGASVRLFPSRRGAAATVTSASIRQPPSENDVAKAFHGVGEPDRAEVQLAANVRDHVVGVLSGLPVAGVELQSRSVVVDVEEPAEFPRASEPSPDPLLELYHPLAALAIDDPLPVAQSPVIVVDISDDLEEQGSIAESPADEPLFVALDDPPVCDRPASPTRESPHVDTGNWPPRTTGFHRADMISALDACPSASSVQLALETSEHFQASRDQAEMLRTRYADLASMEGHVLAKVRSLLPVAVDANSAIAAVQRIGERCDRFADRQPPPPFE